MKLRALLFSFFVVGLSASLFSQSMSVLNYINELGNKPHAVYGDAVKLIVLDMGEKTLGFQNDLAVLNSKNITSGYALDENTALRKGVLARLIARYLDLSDSLFYNIFETERYAFRACVAAGIMVSNGSEWDPVSGEELLEIMRMTAEISGENR